MSQMKSYRDGKLITETEDHPSIAARLQQIGVRFERWHADAPLAADASPEQVLAAYRDPVARLVEENGLQSGDVIHLGPDHPQRDELRAKFLSEHVHDDFEIRFFVAGKGLFYLRPNDDEVLAVLCEQGDLISVPAGVRHWFDMGPRPDFPCIRLFTPPEGWVARFTGDPVADDYPRLEAA